MQQRRWQVYYFSIQEIHRHGWYTCGCSALKGGMPTRSSNRMTPTDHQSAVIPTIRTS